MAKTLSNLIRSGSANTPLPVSFGGTGVITLTGLVKADGTNAFSTAVSGVDYIIPGGNLANCTNLSLTPGVTGTLPVANGGTGTISLTANSVLLGNGTSTLQTVSPGTNGNLLTSNNGTWVSAPAPISLPTQTGNNGKYLTTDGTNATWGSISGGASITNDTTTNFNYTIPMSNVVSGTWATAYIANTKLYFNPSTGTLYSTVFQALSDKTVKNNIITISNGLSTINALNGVEFTWKETDKPSAGVIAQELESILPALVTENEGIKSVNYLGIIGYLIEAVKELSSKIEKLENR